MPRNTHDHGMKTVFIQWHRMIVIFEHMCSPGKIISSWREFKRYFSILLSVKCKRDAKLQAFVYTMKILNINQQMLNIFIEVNQKFWSIITMLKTFCQNKTITKPTTVTKCDITSKNCSKAFTNLGYAYITLYKHFIYVLLHQKWSYVHFVSMAATYLPHMTYSHF